MRFLIIILMFFILGALFIISNNDLALSKNENFEEFKFLYLSWLDNIYDNLLTITGQAVELSWIPDPTG